MNQIITRESTNSSIRSKRQNIITDSTDIRRKYILRAILWQYIENWEQMEKLLAKEIGLLITKKAPNPLIPNGLSDQ